MRFFGRLNDENGYSLAEVMASIVILTLAVIPMVAMFSSGLKAANTSGDYDTARALANKKLEQVKSLSYNQAKDNFPRTPPTQNKTDGSTTGMITNSSEADVPAGFGYTVTKVHLRSVENAVTPGVATMTPNSSGDLTDTGLIRIAVTVSWGGNKTYTTNGVVSKDTP